MTRHTHPALPLLVLAAVLLGGCGAEQPGGDDADALRTEVDTVGGAVHVTNAGTAPTWHLEPLLALTAADDAEFGRVTGVVGDWGGNVYVADAIVHRIYRFGPDGTLSRAMGGEGAGPGEFRAMKGLAWVGGRLASLDAGNARVGLIAPDGTPAGAVQWQPLTGDITLEQTAPGEAYAPLAVFGEPGQPSSRVHLRITGPGAPDTLRDYRVEPRDDGSGVVCESPRQIGFFTVPYSSRPYAARAPSRRTVVAETGRYRLAFVDSAGDTTRVIARDVVAVPVTDADWAPADSLWADFQENNRGGNCTHTSISRPAAKPAFVGTFFDDRGRLWVEAQDSAGLRFDIYDTTGALRGQMPAPERDRSVTPTVRTARLHYVTLDSLDVQTVRVARIVEAAAGTP